jgi:trinucleotide repeat-containing gene 6 protein
LHPGGPRNSWDDPHTPNWEDKAHLGPGGGITPWNEGPNPNPMWNKNKPTWPDNSEMNNEWPQPKLSNASSEIIRSSKQFRVLIESGFKKDDAEIALRTTNMNVEEAMELLHQQQRNNSGIEQWHQGGAGSAFDHSPFPTNRYPGPQTMPFPPNNPKLPNSSGAGPGANIGGLQMQLNKHLPHQAGTPAFTQQAAAASQSGSAGGQPSAHHLRNLVQQIQKAVQAGYLNHQILNQPLAPQTLQLLNSLLNTIQQLQYTQQSIQRNGGVNSIQLQMTIQKQKQQISQLQSQIAQQQSLYIKSQAGGGGGGTLGGNEFLRQNSQSSMGMGNHNDPIVSLENNLAGLGLKQEPSPYPSNTTSQQSRLNQWKLPSALDNKPGEPVDFSRAPGTTSKQSLPPTTPTSISSIGIHNDPGTWSSGRNDAGGWPDSTIESENKDWPASNQSPAFTDLVPEFQPGKPWKVKLITNKRVNIPLIVLKFFRVHKRTLKTIHQLLREVLHVTLCPLVQQNRNPTCLVLAPLKRPRMRYFRLPHGALIHPQQRNKISVAQCQNWVRKRQRLTVGRIQHQIYGRHLRQLVKQVHLLVWVLQKMVAHPS